MKSRQFIVLILTVIVWFVYLWYKIDKLQEYTTNIDENVATIDERIVWNLQPKIESVYDKFIYWL